MRQSDGEAGQCRHPLALSGPEQRIALVIGNSKYQNTVQLSNPGNDTKAVAQLLNSAGFEVISATDLSHNQMIQAVQEFSGKIAGRGPNTVAMVYYAGHGVQLAGENYLVPVDAKISSEPDLINGSLRLVDVMATLEAIPSRVRIVILDACRNNPFPSINDAGRGLAIVDAPKGSIVAYSTAPGTEALDGTGDHSPYTAAFLRLANEKEPADRAAVQAHPPGRRQFDRRATDPLGKLVADQRLLFLRRYRRRGHPGSGADENGLCGQRSAVAFLAAGL